MRSKKRVTWDPDLKDAEPKGFPQKRQKISKITETEKYKMVVNDIELHLKNSLIDPLIVRLHNLRGEQKSLPSYMEEIGFRMFDWSLEHNNFPLAHFVLNNFPKNSVFIMINRDNYAQLKNFLDANLGKTDLDISVEEGFVAILEAILKVEPNWEIKKVMNDRFFSASIHPSVIERIKSRLLLLEQEPTVLSQSNLSIFQVNNILSSIGSQGSHSEAPEKDMFPHSNMEVVSCL